MEGTAIKNINNFINCSCMADSNRIGLYGVSEIRDLVQ